MEVARPLSAKPDALATMQSFVADLLAKTPEGSDRRRHERITWTTAAVLEIRQDDGADQPSEVVQVVTVDLSVGGFGCISATPLEDGTRVASKFLEIEFQPIVPGIVRYSRTVKTEVAPYYRIGIEFDEPFDVSV